MRQKQKSGKAIWTDKPVRDRACASLLQGQYRVVGDIANQLRDVPDDNRLKRSVAAILEAYRDHWLPLLDDLEKQST